MVASGHTASRSRDRLKQPRFDNYNISPDLLVVKSCRYDSYRRWTTTLPAFPLLVDGHHLGGFPLIDGLRDLAQVVDPEGRIDPARDRCRAMP